MISNTSDGSVSFTGLSVLRRQRTGRRYWKFWLRCLVFSRVEPDFFSSLDLNYTPVMHCDLHDAETNGAHLLPDDWQPRLTCFI
jgi:hypothetical protein